MRSAGEVFSSLAWKIRPQDTIAERGVRVSEGRYLETEDGSRRRLVALFRVKPPASSGDSEIDYAGAIRAALQQQRLKGLFEGLRKASVPFMYTVLLNQFEREAEKAPVFEFDLVVGTWADGGKDDAEETAQAVEQRASVLSATLGVALADAAVARLLREDLVGFLKAMLLPGRRSLSQAAAPGAAATICTFDEVSPASGELERLPEFYVPNSAESGKGGIVLGALRSGGGEFHEFRLQLDDLRRHICVLGMSLDHDEPIVYKNRGQICVGKIGTLVDSYFDDGKEGRAFSTGLECVAFDPATGSVDWSPIRYVLRHRHEGKMLRIRLETGRRVTVTPNHSVFALVHGAVKQVNASELQRGDYLVGPKAIPDTPAYPASINLIELLKEEDGVFLYDVPVAAYDRALIPGREGFERLGYLPIKFAGLLTPEETNKVSIGYRSSRERIRPTLKVDGDLAGLMGIYAAGGSVAVKVKKHYTVTFTFGPKDERLVANCQRILFEKFGISASVKAHGRDSRRLRFGHRILACLFESLIGRGAKNKRFPAVILNSPARVRRAFIRSWMAGGSGATASSDLMNGVAYALLLDRCLAKISHRKARAKTVIGGLNVSSLPSYLLKSPSALGYETDRPRFERTSELGPLYPMAQVPNPLSKACSRVMMRGHLSRKRLGEIEARVRKLESYTTMRELDVRQDGFYRSYSGRFLRRWGKRILPKRELRLARQELEGLELLAKSDLSFLRVAGVEEVPRSSEFVYDVSVPGKENFLAGFGGVFCHNTGSGKSTTAAAIVKQVAAEGLPTMVLDWHNEYGKVVSSVGGKVVAPGKDEFSVNPLAMGPGADPVEHIAAVADIFSDIYHFTHPQAYMFRNALQKRMSESSTEEVPDILSLVRTIEAYPLRSAYDNETKVALLRRLVPLTQGQSGRALGSQGPVTFEELLRTVVCLELGHMRDVQARAVFADVMLKMVYEEKVRKRSSLDHLTVVEEARNLAPARRPEDPPSVGEKMISELRKFGEAMMFVAQFPSHVASEVVKNSGTKVVHRLAWPDDVTLIGDSLGLTRGQREHLTRLRVGEAIVGVSRIQEPFLVQVRPEYGAYSETKPLSLGPDP